jgi:hypothetical protein
MKINMTNSNTLLPSGRREREETGEEKKTERNRDELGERNRKVGRKEN